MSMILRLRVWRRHLSVVDRLFDQDRITIGRAEDSTIPLEGRFVSRSHLVFDRGDRGWWAENRGSNGTLVDGKPLTSRLLIEGPVFFHLDDYRVEVSPEDPNAPKPPGSLATPGFVEEGENAAERPSSGLLVSIRVGTGILQGESFRFFHLPISIGRDRRQDLVLPEDFISREHARIELAAGGLAVRNASQKNKVMAQGRVLAPGEAITIGDRGQVVVSRLLLEIASHSLSRELTESDQDEAGGEVGAKPAGLATLPKPQEAAVAAADSQKKESAKKEALVSTPPSKPEIAPVTAPPAQLPAFPAGPPPVQIVAAPSIHSAHLLILRVNGILDLVRVPHFEEKMRESVLRGWRFLGVDFSGVERLDSSALSSIVQLLVEVERAGRKVRIFGVRTAVQEILVLANVRDFFAGYFCRDEAATASALGLRKG